MKTQTFKPHIESIHAIQEFVTGFLPSDRYGPERVAEIELVIEEIVLNVINYGFEERTDGAIDIGLDDIKEGIRITISDNGCSFNPLEQKPPDLEADLDERQVGGLGIFFVRQLVKEMRYSRENGKNKLVLTF